MDEETPPERDDERTEPEAQDEPPPKRMDLSNVRDLPPPTPRPKREIKVDLPPYDEREGVQTGDRLAIARDRKPGFVQKSARTVAGFAIFALLLVGVYFALSAFDDGKKPVAAWNKQSAPDVRPGGLGAQ